MDFMEATFTKDDPQEHRLLPNKCTAQHWQLRSLLAPSPTCPHTVFYISDRSLRIQSVSPLKPQNIEIAQFSFKPRCLSVAHGYACVGGPQRGQFAIVRLSPAETGSTTANGVRTLELSGTITNSVTIFKDAQTSHVKALICNNDTTIRIRNLSLGTPECTIRLGIAMNHAVASLDGRYVVAVGDSRDVFLFERFKGSSSHPGVGDMKLKAAINIVTDASFSTAFAPCSRVFAVAAQNPAAVHIFSIVEAPKPADDGNNESQVSSPITCLPTPSASPTFIVYEPESRSRSWPSPTLSDLDLELDSSPSPPQLVTSPFAKVAMIPMTRSFPHGSPRHLAFAPAPLDLLLVTESTNKVHLICTRTWRDSQILSIPGTPPPPSPPPLPSHPSSSAAASRRDHGDWDGPPTSLWARRSRGESKEICGAGWGAGGSCCWVATEGSVWCWRVDRDARRCFGVWKMR
ncbi:hypothetical protein YB2330_004100 [Saitoella coloradoensis]